MSRKRGAKVTLASKESDTSEEVEADAVLVSVGQWTTSAGALIHEVGLVMAFHGSAEDLARTSHAHPTLNEIVKEAALGHGR